MNHSTQQHGQAGTFSSIRTIFWLRGKLTLRQFTRERGRILGAIVALVIFGPIIVGATIGTALGYQRLFSPLDVGLLGGVFVLLWLIWLLFPVLFSAVNEGMDITRLLIYPLSRRDLIISTLLGTLFDYPTYLILPLFGAMIFGFGFSLPLIIAIVLCYAHAVIIGQLMLTIVGGIVQSRRFRDVTIVFFSLLGTTCYFFQQAFISFTESLGDNFSEEQILSLDPLNYLQWFPTGALAQFINQANDGNWTLASLWLGYSVLLLAMFILIWVTGLYRLATGQGFLLNVRPKEAKERKEVKARRENGRFQTLPFLPDDISALVIKEFRSVWRIPQRRVGLVQGLIFPVFMATGLFFGSGGDEFSFGRFPALAAYALPPYALFAYWATAQNMLAWEGRGLASLFLTPVPRHRIFVAKGLALFFAAGAPYFVIGVIFNIFLPGWQSLLGLLTGLVLGVVTMAVTAVASVMFPIRINVEVKQTRNSFQMGGGCRSSLGGVVLTPIIIVILCVPPAAPLGLAIFLQKAWIGALGLLFGIVYAGFLFWRATLLAGNLLIEREPEVLEALRQLDDA